MLTASVKNAFFVGHWRCSQAAERQACGMLHLAVAPPRLVLFASLAPTTSSGKVRNARLGRVRVLFVGDSTICFRSCCRCHASLETHPGNVLRNCFAGTVISFE